MGDPDFGAGTSGLYDVTPDVDPLPGVAESAWQDAPADCEGRLDALDDLRFAVASVQYGLVAAVDDEGHVVCVDTLDGVQDELNANGHPEDASELGLRFIAVANLGVPLIDLAAADPSPQPSVTADPSPQPSTDPRVPDPTM